MRSKYFFLPGSFIKIATLLIFIQCITFFCDAQSFIGYHSSTYAGVYAVLINPSDILNHRFRGDINLVGVSSFIGNNVLSFKYSNKNLDKIVYPNPITKNGKSNFNTDVFGPSFLIKLSDKNALALTTRARVFSNVSGVSKDILNSTLQDSIDLSLINNNLSISNHAATAHAWKEVALTYSRQIANTDYGVWKAGLSLKLLSGEGALFFNTNNLSFVHDSIIDTRDNLTKDAIINLQGKATLKYTKNLDSLPDNINDYLTFKNPGVGIDVGLSYEYRDEMQVYETAYSDKTANYIWKVGASITDIGFIRYNKQKINSYAVNFSGNTYLTDQLNTAADSSGIDYYKNLFNASASASTLTMQLPTTLHLAYDRFFNRLLGVQALLNVPLVFSRLTSYSGNYNPVSFIVTPRAETPWGGAYLPVSYNAVSGFNAGVALRLGPLVIGSSSIINTRILNKTKALDAYFILRIPFFGYKDYKDKSPFYEHPELTRKQRKALDCPQKL